MAYTTIDKPSDYFDTKLYTGTGSNNITLTMDNVGWVWMKNRTNSGNHILMDIVRGGNNSNSQKPVLLSNTSGAEQGSDITATGGVAFGSTSTVIGSDNGGYNYNNSASSNYVAWHWGTGTSFSNDASSTSIGSIDSAGSVNTDAGFSIVSYTGTGSTGTVAHGLGVKPSFLIYKNRATTDSWNVQSDGLTSYDYYLRLNSTGSQNNNIDVGPTAPTSTVVTVGSHAQQNGDGNAMILYAFAEKQGYSKFGNYIGTAGNNGDAPFIYTGFKPAWFMVKNAGATSAWEIYDSKLLGYNDQNHQFRANANDALSAVSDYVDFVSNGIKIRHNSTGINEDGDNFIYMAFAENPFVTSTGVPATAR